MGILEKARGSDAPFAQADRTAITYSVHTEWSDLASMGLDWDELLDRSECNRAFSCSKWYMAMTELLPGVQPLVLVACRENRLAGIMPLVLDSAAREAGFAKDYTDCPDIIAQAGDIEVIAGLLNFAISGTGGYDRLVLRFVKDDSNCVKGAIALGLGKDSEGLFVPGSTWELAVLDFSRGYEEYLKTLSRHFRLSLNRVRNKAQREGLAVTELKPDDISPEEIPGLFLSLHLSRFGAGSNFNVDFRLGFAAVESWIRKLFPSLFAEGRIRIFALMKETKIVGISVVMVGKRGLYGWPGGFLPEVERYHPGKLLIHNIVRQACLERLEEFDLGFWIRRDEEYKGQWRPVIKKVGHLQFLAHIGSNPQT